MSEIILPIMGGLTTTAPAQIAHSAGGRPYLLLDGTVDESVIYSLRMPSDYASALTLIVHYSMATATTNNVAVRTQVMAVSDGENVDTDSFATLSKSADKTVPGTAGLMDVITHTLTNLDSLVASDYFAIHIARENATTGTNATGDMEIWALSLTYTAS